MNEIDANLRIKKKLNTSTKRYVAVLKEYACTNFPEICLSKRCSFVFACQHAASMKKKGRKNEDKRQFLAKLAAIHSEGTQDFVALQGITKYL